MSIVKGNVVPPLSLRRILKIAESDRTKLGLEALHQRDLINVVERVLPRQFGVEYDYVESSALPHAHAQYSAIDRKLDIRSEVRDLVERGDADARFTILHEIGHVRLHGDLRFARANANPGLCTRFCCSEFQADMYAIAIVAPPEVIGRFPSARRLAAYLRLPEQYCGAFLHEYVIEKIGAPGKQIVAELPLGDDRIQLELF